MRFLGLDLGTKSLGVSITDKANILAHPLTVINFAFEDYEKALGELLIIIDKYNISKVILGLPKNMDGSIGFAGERSIKFQKMLINKNIDVELMDERLTTKLSENVIHENLDNIKNSKNKIDAISATIILDDYLKRCSNDNKE